MAGFWRRIATNIADVRAFGGTVIFRHFRRHGVNRDMTANVAGIGAVHFRAGESDIATLRQIFIGGDYDIKPCRPLYDRVMTRYRQILDVGKTPVIADIGANIGAAGLWFRREFPDAAIVAVEPDPGNVSILRRNFAGRPGMHVVEAAIGSSPGHVTLDNAGSGWAVQTRRSESGVAVVTTTDVFAHVIDGTPFIVKIDIEGFESDLFADNLGWITQSYAVMIEPHDWMLPGRMTSQNFQRAMAQHPFEMFIRGENILYVRL
jgi:FkbM family methyltransferase